MKLKVIKNINRRIIDLELETTNFTTEENKMIDILGEPIISFKKVYLGKYETSIEKRIRTGFKTKIKIDGTTDLVEADSVTYSLIEDVTAELSNAMWKLKELYDGLQGTKEYRPQIIDIVY